MKHQSEFILSLLIASFLLCSCAAVQYPIPVDQTIQGMADAVRGAPGTWAFARAESDIIVLGWTTSQRYAFVLIDGAGRSMRELREICATSCNWRTAADFFAWLESNGWASVPAGTLPAALVEAIKTSAFQAMISRMYMPLLIPVLVPADPADLIRRMEGA